MAVWSSLGRAISEAGFYSRAFCRNGFPQNVCSSRLMSSHRRFQIEPSRWQWHKSKDLFHFYVAVALIPLGLVSFYCNFFIGPAQLAAIPEGYEPKEWEYYRHPITRFMVKYLFASEQQVYEKHCHQLYEDYDLAEINRVEHEVRSLQAKRQDYKHWYYVPVEKKFAQVIQEDAQEMETLRGTPSTPYN